LEADTFVIVVLRAYNIAFAILLILAEFKFALMQYWVRILGTWPGRGTVMIL
jgi:hypothetical protein